MHPVEVDATCAMVTDHALHQCGHPAQLSQQHQSEHLFSSSGGGTNEVAVVSGGGTSADPMDVAEPVCCTATDAANLQPSNPCIQHQSGIATRCATDISIEHGVGAAMVRAAAPATATAANTAGGMMSGHALFPNPLMQHLQHLGMLHMAAARQQQVLQLLQHPAMQQQHHQHHHAIMAALADTPHSQIVQRAAVSPEALMQAQTDSVADPIVGDAAAKAVPPVASMPVTRSPFATPVSQSEGVAAPAAAAASVPVTASDVVAPRAQGTVATAVPSSDGATATGAATTTDAAAAANAALQQQQQEQCQLAAMAGFRDGLELQSLVHSQLLQAQVQHQMLLQHQLRSMQQLHFAAMSRQLAQLQHVAGAQAAAQREEENEAREREQQGGYAASLSSGAVERSPDPQGADQPTLKADADGVRLEGGHKLRPATVGVHGSICGRNSEALQHDLQKQQHTVQPDAALHQRPGSDGSGTDQAVPGSTPGSNGRGMPVKNGAAAAHASACDPSAPGSGPLDQHASRNPALPAMAGVAACGGVPPRAHHHNQQSSLHHPAHAHHGAHAHAAHHPRKRAHGAEAVMAHQMHAQARAEADATALHSGSAEEGEEERNGNGSSDGLQGSNPGGEGSGSGQDENGDASGSPQPNKAMCATPHRTPGTGAGAAAEAAPGDGSGGNAGAQELSVPAERAAATGGSGPSDRSTNLPSQRRAVHFKDAAIGDAQAHNCGNDSASQQHLMLPGCSKAAPLTSHGHVHRLAHAVSNIGSTSKLSPRPLSTAGECQHGSERPTANTQGSGSATDTEQAVAAEPILPGHAARHGPVGQASEAVQTTPQDTPADSPMVTAPASPCAAMEVPARLPSELSPPPLPHPPITGLQREQLHSFVQQQNLQYKLQQELNRQAHALSHAHPLKSGPVTGLMPLSNTSHPTSVLVTAPLRLPSDPRLQQHVSKQGPAQAQAQQQQHRQEALQAAVAAHGIDNASGGDSGGEAGSGDEQGAAGGSSRAAIGNDRQRRKKRRLTWTPELLLRLLQVAKEKGVESASAEEVAQALNDTSVTTADVADCLQRYRTQLRYAAGVGPTDAIPPSLLAAVQEEALVKLVREQAATDRADGFQAVQEMLWGSALGGPQHSSCPMPPPAHSPLGGRRSGGVSTTLAHSGGTAQAAAVATAAAHASKHAHKQLRQQLAHKQQLTAAVAAAAAAATMPAGASAVAAAASPPLAASSRQHTHQAHEDANVPTSMEQGSGGSGSQGVDFAGLAGQSAAPLFGLGASLPSFPGTSFGTMFNPLLLAMQQPSFFQLALMQQQQAQHGLRLPPGSSMEALRAASLAGYLPSLPPSAPAPPHQPSAAAMQAAAMQMSLAHGQAMGGYQPGLAVAAPAGRAQPGYPHAAQQTLLLQQQQAQQRLMQSMAAGGGLPFPAMLPMFNPYSSWPGLGTLPAGFSGLTPSPAAQMPGVAGFDTSGVTAGMFGLPGPASIAALLSMQQQQQPTMVLPPSLQHQLILQQAAMQAAAMQQVQAEMQRRAQALQAQQQQQQEVQQPSVHLAGSRPGQADMMQQ